MPCEILIMEDLVQLVFDFIADPQNSLYDPIYRRVVDTMRENDGQSSLRRAICVIIKQIYDEMNQMDGEEAKVALVHRKLCRFNERVMTVHHLFEYYDLAVENADSVIGIAAEALVRFFTQEKADLKKQMVAALGGLLRSNEDIPMEMKLISRMVRLCAENLYSGIFESKISSEIEKYSEFLDLENKSFDEILEIFQNYFVFSDKMSEVFDESTVTIFHDSFVEKVIAPKIGVLINKESIEYCAQNIEKFKKLKSILDIGVTSWKKDVVQYFKIWIKEQLNLINEPAYYRFCEKVADIYSSLLNSLNSVFSDPNDDIFHCAFNVVSQFLEERSFINEVCLIIHQQLKEIPFLNVLHPFILTDLLKFEENYNYFLAQRLLTKPNPTLELELIKLLEANQIKLDKSKLILKDFMNAPNNTINYNNTEVSLILLNQCCWSMLNKIQFRPPKIFQQMFEQSCTEIKKQGDFFRKLIHLNERWSSVEFSDGTTTFTLPFIYACFVQTVLERGPISQTDLCKLLEISESVAQQQVLEFLFRAKILQKKDDNLIYFVGPPSNVINDVNEEHVFDKHTELELDPKYYSDCYDQINASILRILKKERYLFEEQIRERVYQLVPSHFPVTDEKIKNCLTKLLELGYIIHHGSKNNAYRYCPK